MSDNQIARIAKGRYGASMDFFAGMYILFGVRNCPIEVPSIDPPIVQTLGTRGCGIPGDLVPRSCKLR